MSTPGAGSHALLRSPPTGATERCGNFANCGTLVSRRTAAGMCGACRGPVYCTPDCQRAHWHEGHKIECKEIRRERTMAASTAPMITGAVPPFTRTLAGARSGDALAQYNVAISYETGTGVAQSFSSAFEWFTRCAAQADPPREVWAPLGDCYRLGRGVAKDEVEAVRLYRVGAEAGDAAAQLILAFCCEGGVGVSVPDVDAAFTLYMAAAAQDQPVAIVSLGACYYEGRGVARDALRALSLWQRVLTHPRASPSAIAAAARSFGLVHLKGDAGVPRDAELGTRYLRQAAAAGDETAARVLRQLGLA